MEYITISFLVLAFTNVVLASSIPFLWWKTLRQELKLEEYKKDLEKLDRIMCDLMDIANIKRDASA